MHHIRLFLSSSWPATGGYPTLAQWLFAAPCHFGAESVHLSDLSDTRSEGVCESCADAQWQRHAERLKLADLLLVPLFCPEILIGRVQRELDLAIQCRKPVLAIRRQIEGDCVSISTSHTDTVCDWGREAIVTALGSLWLDTQGRSV